MLNQGPNGAKVGKRIGKLGQGRAVGRAIDAFLRFTHPRAAQEGREGCPEKRGAALVAPVVRWRGC